MREIIYLSELTLPSTSAQALQILKMCDSFSEYRNVTLIIKDKKKNINPFNIKKKLQFKKTILIF